MCEEGEVCEGVVKKGVACVWGGEEGEEAFPGCCTHLVLLCSREQISGWSWGFIPGYRPNTIL